MFFIFSLCYCNYFLQSEIHVQLFTESVHTAHTHIIYIYIYTYTHTHHLPVCTLCTAYMYMLTMFTATHMHTFFLQVLIKQCYVLIYKMTKRTYRFHENFHTEYVFKKIYLKIIKKLYDIL